VEPSASMRAQRPPHLPRAIDAVAEHLPFEDRSFDASMTIFSVHQWSDLKTGLGEMRRVTRGPMLVMTCDPGELDRFWLKAYAPQVIAVEARRYPQIEAIRRELGDHIEIVSVPIPFDCTDGFGEAFYGRPELLLDAGARLACSAWSFVPPSVEARFVADLSRDLESGAWDSRYGRLRAQPQFDGSLKLIISRGPASAI
jgi:hypothetical protein